MRYWVHNGYLTANGEKMSKSLGNFFTVRDLLEKAPGEAIRLYLLKTHYRMPLDWTLDGLAQARHVLDRFYTALRQVADVKADAEPEIPENMRDALEDDINTFQAIAALHEIVGALNKAADAAEKARLKGALLAGGGLLGLLSQDPEAWFMWEAPSRGEGMSESEIEDLIAQRARARKNKDFAEADRIRDILVAQGIFLEDKAEGTIWRRTG